MSDLVSILILGLVQGLTEFLPVSSSAHLVFLTEVAKIRPNLPEMFLLTSLHFGTLIALLVYFYPRIKAIALDCLSGREGRVFALKLILVTLVSGLVALKLDPLAELLVSQPRYTAGILTAMGFILLGTRTLRLGDRDARDLRWGEAILLGLVQAIAVFPGISRSGITITLLLLLGFSPLSAFELSFLAGIPIIALAFLYSAIKSPAGFGWVSSAGILIAFLSGMVSLALLRRVVLARLLFLFGIYCIGVSLLVCWAG